MVGLNPHPPTPHPPPAAGSVHGAAECWITVTGECRASGLFGKTKDHLFTLKLSVSSQDCGQVTRDCGSRLEEGLQGKVGAKR